jgi:hypothetical protein
LHGADGHEINSLAHVFAAHEANLLSRNNHRETFACLGMLAM